MSLEVKNCFGESDERLRMRMNEGSGEEIIPEQ